MDIQSLDLSDSLRELSELSKDQLSRFYDSMSDVKCDEMVRHSGQVKRLEAEREVLMASVRSLADLNLAQREDYECLRDNLAANVMDCNRLGQSVRDEAKILSELRKKTSVKATMEALNRAAKQAEEECENITRQYESRFIDHDSFINQYLDRRRLAYLRLVKAKLLSQEKVHRD